ncbi:hypothetical protein ACIBL3_38705 [Kribbella sp. NPDC050124]|uniref:hypothetical protein n=1 Tax=Kribbella sp. NPDC050124 TaxID=3364114 RepID=UPI0037942831
MAIKTITRTAAGAATIAIAGLALTTVAPADATNKPEPGGGTVIVDPAIPPTDNGRSLDLAQIASGALGGVALTTAGFVAATRRHRPSDSTPRPA